MTLNNNRDRFTGEDLFGSFSIDITTLPGSEQPTLTDIDLRLIGKTSLSLPDADAVFDLRVGAGIVVDSNEAGVVSGTWSIDGGSTANLRPSGTASRVVIQYEFLAYYAGNDDPVVLERASFQLRADRVAQPHVIG